jgi:hypothetical protein
MAASAATQEALWQARLLQQLGMQVDLRITIYEDNKSAIMFADHPGDHRTTKHIDTKINFAREAQTNGFIKLVYVPTAEQSIDCMTKDLPSSLSQSICLDHYFHRLEFDLIGDVGFVHNCMYISMLGEHLCFYKIKL